MQPLVSVRSGAGPGGPPISASRPRPGPDTRGRRRSVRCARGHRPGHLAPKTRSFSAASQSAPARPQPAQCSRSRCSRDTSRYSARAHPGHVGGLRHAQNDHRVAVLTINSRTSSPLSFHRHLYQIRAASAHADRPGAAPVPAETLRARPPVRQPDRQTLTAVPYRPVADVQRTCTASQRSSSAESMTPARPEQLHQLTRRVELLQGLFQRDPRLQRTCPVEQLLNVGHGAVTGSLLAARDLRLDQRADRRKMPAMWSSAR